MLPKLAAHQRWEFRRQRWQRRVEFQTGAVHQSVHFGRQFFQLPKNSVSENPSGEFADDRGGQKEPRIPRDHRQKRTIIEGIPRFINMCHDQSCNLSCPSCRLETISHVKGGAYDQAKGLHDKLVATYLTEPSDQAFTLSITGSGDPFGSRVFREFLCDFDGANFPNMRINLQTNGVMFTPKQWQRLHKLHGKIKCVIVSFDAATEPTYNITRRGGRWNLLLATWKW